MKRLMCASLLSLLIIADCQPTLGIDETFDVSGHQIFGDYGDEFPSFSTSFGVPGTVTDVVIDVTGESFGESWNSEVTFSLDTDSQFDDIWGFDVGLPDAPGPFTVALTVPTSVGSIDGEVFLTLWETFVDNESPNSAFGANSSITITFKPYVPVPPPPAVDLGSIATADTPFSLDTFSSSFDTWLGLYDANGIIIDFNDDADSRPTQQSELIFAGGLSTGEYYAVIGGNVTEFGPLGFDAVPQPGSAGGDFVLNYPTGPTTGTLPEESVMFFSFSIGSLEPSADFDSDGDVDGDDFLAWQSSFGNDGGGDADGDGDTDGDDFLIWQSQFGSGNGSGSHTVPEPAIGALMLLLIVVQFAAAGRPPRK